MYAIRSYYVGGWDIFEDNVYEAVKKAQVLSNEDAEAVKGDLEKIKPWKGVFDKRFVKKLDSYNFV